MGIIRSAITLAAAGLAVNMVLKARRDGRMGRVEGSVGSPSLPRGAWDNSPSEAERLAASGTASTVFSGEKGESARSPGLPDFARGT